MESPSRALTLSPSPSRRRRSSSDSVTSPEFQFWNSEHVTTPLHSADQLFSNGFLLPLRSLQNHSRSEPVKPDIEPGPSALITSQVSSNGNPILSASKRWKEIIFKRSDKNGSSSSNNNDLDEGKSVVKVEKRREKSSAELNININIWPFSRSRSAGNNTTRSNNKPATSNRKVSSAPCSRSNSSGESKSLRRAWPASPGRVGVHVGRASPVWNVKRVGPGVGARKERVNVVMPVSVGSYRQGLGCRSEGDGVVGVDGGGKGGGVVKSGGGGNNGNLFGFRGLFGRKSSNGSAVLTV